MPRLRLNLGPITPMGFDAEVFKLDALLESHFPMNNQQFRRLITDNNDERAPAQRSAQPAAALGSRARPSVVMTP